MAERDILAIALAKDPGELAQTLTALKARHAGAHLTLLTAGPLPPHLPADEVWTDGRAMGPGAFLALARRISWARFEHVYDLEGSFRVRLLRWLTVPRPHWHQGLTG